MASSWWASLLASTALAFLVAAVFCPLMGFEFVDFDTFFQIHYNLYINGMTLENVKQICTQPGCGGATNSFYPVRTLTYALDCEFWGLDAGGFKLTNVLIHLANVLLLFWFVRRLFRDPFALDGSGGSGWSISVAAFAAGIFAVHPVVVEPVAWIPGREELLMTLGALGCIHCHIGFRRQAARRSDRLKWAFFAGSLFCCGFACLSNAVGAVIPMLTVAWDALMLRQRGWRKLRAILFGNVLLWIIGIATIVTKKLDSEASISVATAAQLTWSGRVQIGLNAYWLNLTTLVWPAKLALTYDWLYPEGFLDIEVVLGVFAVLLSFLVLSLARRRRLIVFGLVWFGIALMPTLQTVSHHIHRADRFLYLPLIGLLIAMAMALRRLGGRITGRAAIGGAITVAMALLAAAAVRSGFQVQTWRTSLSTWRHCIEVDPNNPRAHDAVGDHFARKGQFKQAFEHYEKALEVRPFALEPLETYAFDLATCDPELRDYGRAVELATRACDATLWTDPHARRTLAQVYVAFANNLREEGKYAEAIENYKSALRAHPRYAGAASNLALLLATCPEEGFRNPHDAVRFAEWAYHVEVQPGLNNLLVLGTAYAQAGRFRAAAMATQRALDMANSVGNEALASDLQRQLARYNDLTPPNS